MASQDPDNSNALTAVKDYIGNRKEREMESLRDLFDAQNLESSIDLINLGVETHKLQSAINEIDPNGTFVDWTMPAVENAVNDAKRQWEGKKRIFGGNPQKIYHDILTNINGHSALLEIIPKGNMYVSVVAGAMTALIKASQSHRDTIEKLGKALKDINTEVHSCRTDYSLVRSVQMRDAVAKLYAHIFIFYADAIKWYRSKARVKVINSLQPDFGKTFDSQLHSIQALSAHVQRARGTASAAELRYMRLQEEDLVRDLRTGLQGVEQSQAEIIRRQEQAERQQALIIHQLQNLADPNVQHNLLHGAWLQAGLYGTNLLIENCRATFSSPELSREPTPPPILNDSDDPLVTNKPCLSRDQAGQSLLPESHKACTWGELSTWLRCRIPASFSDSSLPDLESDQNLTLEHGMAIALEQWTTSKDSILLYLESRVSFAFPSPVTQAAGRLTKVSTSLGIPTVSYFCAPHHSDANYYHDFPKNNTGALESWPLYFMIISIAAQVASLMPPASDAPHLQKSCTNQPCLNETSQPLAILEAVLSNGPPLLLCMIDSYDTLDVTSADTMELIQTLNQVIKQSSRDQRVIKILFTCPSRCAAALSVLDDSQVVMLETSKEGGKWPISEDFGQENP